MMAETGFSLEFDTCLNCRHQTSGQTVYFVSELGGIVCKDCASSVPYTKKQMPAKLCDFFKYMLKNDFDTTGEFEQKANDKVCEVTFALLKEYIEKKCSKRIKSSQILSEIPA